jgi:hypothetical protein
MMHGATYELTFKGEAGDALAAAFDGFTLSTAAGVTVVRGDLPDQAALHGLLDRVNALGLEVLGVRQVADIAADEAPEGT